MDFDIVVIGKGLFGASAVRYLSQLSDKVAIIGPDDPADPATHRCVITRTAHKRPYIDEIEPGRLYVAVGGNGQGAKAADEVGRLVAGGQQAGDEFAAVFQ